MDKNKALDSTDESKLTKTKTKTTSTTTSGFALQARKNGIFDSRSSKPSKNLEDFLQRHSKTRATASPPESAYGDYVEEIDRVEKTGNEATLVIETSGKLLKKPPRGYNRVFNRSFTNFPKDVGFNQDLSAPQPDFVEGLEMQNYLPFPVDEHVRGATLYKDNPYSITLPQIAGEWKGPDGSMRDAELQSAYDGAAMVYVRNKALTYMGKSDPPGHAAITTFATDGTTLNMYQHYAAPSEEDPDILQYHQYKYASTNIKDSYQGHKDGRKGLRNAQDHARDQSYALRDQLKEYWKQQHNIIHPVAEEEPLPVPEEEPLPVPEEEPLPVPEEEPLPVPEEEPLPVPDGALGGVSADEEVADEDDEVVEPQPASQPMPPLPSRSKHQKRKSSPLQASSGRANKRRRLRSFWKRDPKSGRQYHVHSDGTVSWLDDEGDKRDYKADNMLQEIVDDRILEASPRKFVGGTAAVYRSRQLELPTAFGGAVLSDFGAAVRGDQKRIFWSL
ncbi:hypothetical protein B0T16DRAFT_451155 [Cercophora newfieldiana]|uniref:Uncharacterized protein n=1 Tax=Cercophora newfieldiana TaxID=92897 RepID=A0AA39YMW7_9PEZI|nr:hypothetical protein B0T16DRAFT_451155 [Cercophora newfieldiana]